eukprot:g15093.t1
MTYAWLEALVEEKLREEWLDLCWFSLIPEMYKVNVAVWEPTGEGKEVQLFKQNMWGLFLFPKKIKHDEEGHKWVHLLYRSGSSWHPRRDVSGRGRIIFHNHFDCLELGADVEEKFDATISVGRDGGSGLRPPLSPVPGRTRTAAVNAESKLKPPSTTRVKRTTTSPQQQEDNRESQALSKRKRSAKTGGSKKKRGGPSGETKRPPGGSVEAGRGGGANYDSDGSIGGGETDWTYHGRTGALPSLTKSQQLLRRKLKKIPEPAYQAAFKRTSMMKAKAEKLRYEREREEEIKNPNRKKSNKPRKKAHPPELEEESGEEEVVWTERGMEDYEASEHFTRRNKMSKDNGRGVSLSAEAREALPSLEEFMQRVELEGGEYSLDNVLETCFDLNFPHEARKLFVDKTNAYVKHCTTDPKPGEEDKRKPHQMKKSATLGHVTLGERCVEREIYGMFEEHHIHGMIGIAITMGLTRKVRMRKHWSRSDHDNYPLVRDCMPRDLFELLYCRFLHCSDPNAPERLLPDGEENPAYDSKWHIRELEEILNTAWASNVECDQWLSYDEQMIKTTSTYSSRVSFFCPAKPIKHGMKQEAACDATGYCLTSSVDGGMHGDPKLRRYMDCPLGRTTRHVLHVLLGECEVLKKKIDGSGVFIAMDNYFTSPTLFECLASHEIFAVGTCRADRTAGAEAYLQSLGRTIPNRGDMNFCRSGQVACVQWKDSKDIFLVSTIHIAQPAEGKKEVAGLDHFKPLPLSLRKKGVNGKALDLQQPWMRMDYVLKMGGVDLADQQNGSHTHDHKSYTNFWRRVFDAKVEQSLTNAFLVFRKWVDLLLRELEADEPLNKKFDVEEVEESERALAALTRLSKVERAVWDEAMATLLMSKCARKNPSKKVNKGGRRPASEKKPPAPPRWGSVTLKSGRRCLKPGCKTRSTKGCTCEEFCTRGGDSGVLMCEKCWKDPSSHEEAAIACWDGASVGRNRKEFEWQKG